jgi:hypothetical protein
MREIHQRYGWPGIALTGYGMEEDIRRVTESGFGAHLVKANRHHAASRHHRATPRGD